MIGLILEQEKAVRQVLGFDRKTTHLIPNWQDLDVMESLDEVLSPLAEFTNILSSEKLVTISSLKPLLHHLKTEVLIRKDLKINDLLDKATFIDPRFRLEYVPDNHVAKIKESILQEAVELTSSERSGVAPLLESPEQPEPSTKKRKLGQILKKKGVTSGDGPLSTRDKAEREIKQYLVCPKIDTEDDPLVWWLQYSSSYPLLSKVAKKYFSICATSKASERLFSISGHIVNSKRTCLKPEKVNMLKFLAKNLDC
ncbi:PREDICTED: zinc finger BED domain-containing protein 1-like [Amphimedon queenslandica]|uniref:HAT C-terminal dimerisation domain-containing protein n=1 Tax=Amphimedon queenslandica TaxID=400682 RepID=A0AAN0JDI9_AMPQE|nr:PREDICTED: zinc finger BED domain-containing protein 1-like [Amphimedon queenslandica]|eukprot:XP_019854816.1 PREDICTED: zinc finger BED domain-containing protein 1-like [Amphimedon queenslandica]